jgi:4-oxalocrotonate tautomerase
MMTAGSLRQPKEHLMCVVNVTLPAGIYTDKQKHDLAARLTDVMVAFEGSEAFREVTWVLIDEQDPHGWHIGGQPYFGPCNLMGTLGRAKAAYEAIGGMPTTPEDLAAQAPVRDW